MSGLEFASAHEVVKKIKCGAQFSIGDALEAIAGHQFGVKREWSRSCRSLSDVRDDTSQVWCD